MAKSVNTTATTPAPITPAEQGRQEVEQRRAALRQAEADLASAQRALVLARTSLAMAEMEAEARQGQRHAEYLAAHPAIKRLAERLPALVDRARGVRLSSLDPQNYSDAEVRLQKIVDRIHHQQAEERDAPALAAECDKAVALATANSGY
jgi:hypothetical protein